ncbi:hypothetical protein V8C37DRAFT_407087 [Trichoderma ceciliae]
MFVWRTLEQLQPGALRLKNERLIIVGFGDDLLDDLQTFVGRVASRVFMDISNSGQQKTNDEYTVGWICAINTEYVAAQAALDEEHERPESVALGDHNDYTLGQVGKHNVVIAVLPDREYGTDSAAIVAKDMMHCFTNIKIGFMVGIGGGAPSERHDIRLGDIVVSTPRDGQSGVLQYDFGKTVQDQPFQATRFLNQSPRILRAAVNGLQSQYRRKGHHQLKGIMDDILERNPALKKEFGRPDLSSDRLYRSEITHPGNGINTPDCAVSCGDDPSKLIERTARIQGENAPVVHYGLIASANTLMKDALVRDQLASEKNILCFEMEAAGLMNQFPCLVVRGICDYSDSHKNKQWQGYAAMAAAAYAKDLLYRILPDNVSTLQRIVRRQEIQSPSDEQKRRLLRSLKFDRCDDRYHNIKSAHAGTCKWLQEKAEYLDWLDPNKSHEHHGFFWIKGKPGAGKSTVMKCALENARKGVKDKIIISFFFNARGDDLEKSTLGMYRSLLLQLLQRLPALQNILDPSDMELTGCHDADHMHQWHIEPLKTLFHQAIENIKTSRCDEDQARDMISFFECLGDLAISKGVSFLVCFSSRHYPYISISNGLSLILENQEEHGRDIVEYVRSELKIGQSNVANQIRADLPKRALGIFMWEYDRGRTHNLQARYQQLPGDLHQLFREILTRRHGENPDELLLCLQWLLFASRPLRPEEKSYISPFILNSSKGLAEVTTSQTPIVQFIHESVKDSLLKEDGLREIGQELGSDILGQSHERLKQCCLSCIGMGSVVYSGNSLPKPFSREARFLPISAKQAFPFLEYAVHNLLYHASAAQQRGIGQTTFLEGFKPTNWIVLRNLFENYEGRRHKPNTTLLYILAERNMSHLIRCHPAKLSYFDVTDERFGTPLLAALATDSNEAIVAFLEAQAETTPLFREPCEEYCRSKVNLSDFKRNFTFSRTKNVLSYFTNLDGGNEILQIAYLLNTPRLHLNLDWRDECNQAPLLYAAGKGFLLHKGFKIDVEGDQGQALLLYAMRNGRDTTAQLLHEEDANTEARGGGDGLTPLLWAVKQDNKAFVRILLEKGVDIEARDSDGLTALSWAVKQKNESIVELLLAKGADIDGKDASGRTPLFWAMKTRDVIELDNGRTLLELAQQAGSKEIIELLNENMGARFARYRW